MIILQNLREKQSDLKQMNREVVMLLDEEGITLEEPYKKYQKNCSR